MNLGSMCEDKPPRLLTRSPARSEERAFTLIEIIISITIIAVLAAASVPMLRGFQDERLAREPLGELVKMAREARYRAMTEKRPYQIAFHQSGFVACRFSNPYITRSELMERVSLSQNPPAPLEEFEKNSLENGGSVTNTTELPLAPPAPKFDPYWAIQYEKPTDMSYSINAWRVTGVGVAEEDKGLIEDDRVIIEGERVVLWVFQPSGICMPMKMRIRRQSAIFDVEFSALTGDIIKETVEIQ